MPLNSGEASDQRVEHGGMHAPREFDARGRAALPADGPDQGLKLRTLLATYGALGGRDAALLLHSLEGGEALIERLGREAQLGKTQGLPARVIPVGH